MSNIFLVWAIDTNGKKIVTAENIIQKIEINEDNKEVKYVKAFFREIIYQSYLNNWDKRIVLKDNLDIEIAEVKVILNQLIDICNQELKSVKFDEIHNVE